MLMRLTIPTVVGLGLLSMVASGGLESIADAHGRDISAVDLHQTSSREMVADTASTCFSHTGHNSGVGILSQNFTDAADTRYDARGVDDFTLATACRIAQVTVVGDFFKGTGPARSETVTFYTNRGNAPGRVISSVRIQGSRSGAGTFTIRLKHPVTLSKGRHWLSVQVNMDGDAGEWSWNTSRTRSGIKAKWRNPHDGFHTGCTTYRPMQLCIGDSGEGPDFEFTLSR